MEQTEFLINALKEWNKETKGDRVNDLETLMFQTLYNLGEKKKILSFSESDYFDILRERINYLIEKHQINEDFLVMGVVDFITKTIEHKISGHGETIICYERIEKSDELNDLSQEKLDELKDINYKEKAVSELDAWKLVTVKYFSKSNRNKWENDRILKREEKQKCVK